MQAWIKPEIAEVALEPEEDVLSTCYYPTGYHRPIHVGNGNCREPNSCYSVS